MDLSRRAGLPESRRWEDAPAVIGIIVAPPILQGMDLTDTPISDDAD